MCFVSLLNSSDWSFSHMQKTRLVARKTDALLIRNHRLLIEQSNAFADRDSERSYHYQRRLSYLTNHLRHDTVRWTDTRCPYELWPLSVSYCNTLFIREWCVFYWRGMGVAKAQLRFYVICCCFTHSQKIIVLSKAVFLSLQFCNAHY